MRKITIVGAGAVGATTAFALSESGICDEIVIIDIDNDRAYGNATDIAHGVPLIKPIKIYSGNYSDSKDSDIVIITVGVPEVVGESRLVPLQKNKKILENIVPKIVENSPKGKILVVSNPVDILTYVVYKVSKLPKNQVLGLGTVLDSSRLRWALSRDFCIDGRNIIAYMIGEHGDTQVPAWSLSTISGVSIDKFAEVIDKKLSPDYFENIHNEIKQSAFDVWEKKGPNCYCVADSIRVVVEAILRNESAILPVSTVLDGEYGLNNVCVSVPSIVNFNGVDKVLDLPLEENEVLGLNKSANMLKELIEKLEI